MTARQALAEGAATALLAHALRLAYDLPHAAALLAAVGCWLILIFLRERAAR